MNLNRNAAGKLGTLLLAAAILVTCGPEFAVAVQDGAVDAGDQATTAITESAESTGMNLFSLLQRGGWFMIPLVALSLIVLAIAFERSLALRRNKIFPKRFVRQLSALSASTGGLEPRTAYEICQQFPSAAATVLKTALVKAGRPQSEIEYAVSEASQRQATKMAQLVSWLGLAAAIAPLIGLLGTVWGITQAFYDTTQLVAGQNRAEALAEGIYTALVTTLIGLTIAIPSAVCAHFFENRIISLMNEIEEMVFNLMPQLERYEGRIRFSDVHAAESNHRRPRTVDSEAAPASAASGDGQPEEQRRRKVPR